jgi:hypothetical protein
LAPRLDRALTVTSYIEAPEIEAARLPGHPQTCIPASRHRATPAAL